MTGLAEAVAALRRGEVIGLPTDTVYGLGALPPFQHRIFELKRRPAEVHVPVLVADTAQATALGRHHPYMDRFWPGALTVVTRASTGDDDHATVGLRCPDHELVRELCRGAGPLAVSSANLHGAPPLTSAASVRAQFPGLLVIDGGRCDGDPSTVVDVTVDPPVVLRQGALRLPL